MKLPAVAIAAVFIGGILLGLYPPIANHAVPHVPLVLSFAACSCLVLARLMLVQWQQLALGTVASMLSWLMLGVLSAENRTAAAAAGSHFDACQQRPDRAAFATALAWHFV